MSSLAELDASNNRLTQVPMTLGDCAGMRALDLSNNQLGLLPLREYILTFLVCMPVGSLFSFKICMSRTHLL